MLNQEQRLQEFKAKADAVETQATLRALKEAARMIRAGFPDRLIRNKVMISLKDIEALRAQIGLEDTTIL